jgi:hypothetical protein
MRNLFFLAMLSSASANEITYIDLAREKHRQVIVDREKGQYLGHPTTALLDDGKTVLCVYPKGHGRGPIVYKRSTDGGRTWSERLPTPASWASSREVPTLFRVKDAAGKKRIIMFSGLYPIRMAVSEDEGTSWGELEPIGDFGGIVAMGTMIAVRGRPGHYRTLFHDDGRFIGAKPQRANPVRFTLYSSLSTDGGLSWGAPETIQSSTAIHLCEPGAVRSPDGKQVAVLLRENARRKNSHVIFSNDEGTSWSEPRELPITLSGDRHTAKYLPDGRLFISFRCRTAIGSRVGIAKSPVPCEGDWAAWVGSYRDIVEGRPGQYLIRIADNKKSWDTTYPGVELLPDGTILTTTYGHWDAGEQPYILSVRLKAKELDARAAKAPRIRLSADTKGIARAVKEHPAKKIWAEAAHSAFTGLVRWREKFYCTFREGRGHAGGGDNGRIRIISSSEGEKWQSVDLLELKGIDLRDPKLSVTPDNRLMCLMGGSHYDGNTLLGQLPRVAFMTKSETKFGALNEIRIDQKIAAKKDWLWRVTWHGETGYGVTYQPARDSSRAFLVKTLDGISYELVSALDIPDSPNEATIRFAAEGRMHVVIRNEGGNRRGYLGTAAAPFTNFNWRQVSLRLGGPDLVRAPGGKWILGSRRYTNPTRTVFGLLGEDGHFEPRVLVPSAGDTSYPGMLIHGDRLWASYYASHEGKSAIYLARIPLSEFE